MAGKTTLRGAVNVALNRLVSDGVLETFKTNFDAERIPGWVPEVAIRIAATAALAHVLERVDAVMRPLGPVMVTWERPDETDPDAAASSLADQQH